MEKIKEQIERLLPQMTRIIVSNRLDKTYQYRKVEVTWTTVRGKELCQIAAYTEKQVFQENVDVEELAGKLLVHFPEHLCQMNIFTEEKEYSFKMTKKGKLLTNATRLPAKQSGTSKLAKTSGSDVADLADKMNSRRGEHNRKKNYILQEGMTVPPLVDMGIFTKEGKVVRSMYDKYKQINRFVELVDDVLKNETKDEIHILDFGCGKSYLTFVLYYYIVEIRKKKAALGRCEREIEAAELAIEALNEKMLDPEIAGDYEQVLEITNQIADLKAQSDALMNEWTALNIWLEENSENES